MLLHFFFTFKLKLDIEFFYLDIGINYQTVLIQTD